MKQFFLKGFSFLLLFSVLTFQTSCTKEKAEALKTSAKAFQAQANSALDKLERLFQSSVAFTPEAKEEFIVGTTKDLKTETFGEESLRAILKESKIKEFDTSDYSKKIAEIRTTYEEFAAMFENLPRGNLFAGDAVKRSENIAVKLTVQMYALGKHIKENPFVSSARLQEIRRKRDLIVATEKDPALLDLKLRAVSEDIFNLSNEVETANNAAIAECAKGATIGLEVAKLIRDYKQFSINDVLQIMKQVIPSVGALTGKNTDDLMGKLNNIQSAIKTDPNWKQIAEAIETEVDRRSAPRAKITLQ